MTKLNHLFLCLVCLLFVSQTNAQEVSSKRNTKQNPSYSPTWSSLDQRKTPEWFQNAKFGIFIHWGVYSVPSWAPTGDMSVYDKYAEWYWKSLKDSTRSGHQQFVDFHERTYGKGYQYQEFAPKFTASMFDADEWASLFKKAGAQYVVLTSKHHEGFCMWPSEQSWNWNSADIGPHRDLAGELTQAVKGKGLKMGFYYSLYEWYNPLYQQNFDAYVSTHMIPQMKDLVQRYQPEVFWTDGEWDHTADEWKSKEFLAWLFNDSPVKETVAVNDRWGTDTRSKHGGYFTTEYSLEDQGEERQTASHPWEECRGIGGSFGYNRNENLEDYQSSEELIHLLIDLVSRGGNLLLNVGPTSDGIIPVIMQERLLEIGKWLDMNGEAIYNTSAVNDLSSESPRICYTRNGKTLYVLIKDKPGNEVLLSGLKGKSNTKVSLLGDRSSVSFTNTAEGTKVDLSSRTEGKPDIPFAYVLKLENYLP